MEATPVYDYRADLSIPATRLAERASQLARRNGRYTLELVAIDGQWLLIVDGGKLENLGHVDATQHNP